MRQAEILLTQSFQPLSAQTTKEQTLQIVTDVKRTITLKHQRTE